MTLLRHDELIFESLGELVSHFNDEFEQVLGTTKVEKILQQHESRYKAVEEVLKQQEEDYIFQIDSGNGNFFIYQITRDQEDEPVEDHNCEDYFEHNAGREFLEETVLVKGECRKCGRSLTSVYDLIQIIDTKTRDTVYEHRDSR